MAMSLFSLALLSEWVASQPLLFCMPESKGKDGRIKSLLKVKYICSQREAHFQLCSLLIYKYKTKYSKPSQTQERQRKDGIFLFSPYLLYSIQYGTGFQSSVWYSIHFNLFLLYTVNTVNRNFISVLR